jgi:hypothetical protein
VRKSLGDQQNVTAREPRRPKERERTKSIDLNWFSVMTLAPQLDFGDEACVSIGLKRCRFRLYWISAMLLIPNLNCGDDAFALIVFRQ